jgi:hypothetical protein
MINIKAGAFILWILAREIPLRVSEIPLRLSEIPLTHNPKDTRVSYTFQY